MVACWRKASRELVIVSDSDGAGQFAILLHALCWAWAHAERLIHKLIPLHERQRQAQESGCARRSGRCMPTSKPTNAPPIPPLWLICARVSRPSSTQKNSFPTLNQTLKRLEAHQSELLLVLLRPDIPLHTNGSENDIHRAVT